MTAVEYLVQIAEQAPDGEEHLALLKHATVVSFGGRDIGVMPGQCEVMENVGFLFVATGGRAVFIPAGRIEAIWFDLPMRCDGCNVDVPAGDGRCPKCRALLEVSNG